MIYEISSFVDESGSKVERLTHYNPGDESIDSVSEDGALKEDMIKFVGVAHMVSDYATTEVRFPIEGAKNLKDAFSMFEDDLNAFMESLKEQMAEQANKPEIIVPDTPDLIR